MPDRDGTTAALVGLGYWGPNVLRVLVDLPDVEVRYLCDCDQTRLERYGRRYPGAKLTVDIQDVLDDPEVDAVCLATPVSTHHELASRALDAGKHVFVEKPLAPSRRLAAELFERATDANRVMMCGHTFLYSPPVRAVKSLIDRDELGDIFFVSSSRVNLGLHQRDVSVIWDLGPHDFSILLFWLDEIPERVTAIGRDSILAGVPDVAFVNLEFSSGLIANVELSWLAPSKLRRTTVVGSRKMVVYDDTSSEQLRIFDHGVIYEDPETFGEYQLSYRTGDIVSPKLDATEPLAIELADFIASVRSGEADPRQLEIAANVVAVVEAAQRSLDDGGRPTNVDVVPASSGS